MSEYSSIEERSKMSERGSLISTKPVEVCIRSRQVTLELHFFCTLEVKIQIVGKKPDIQVILNKKCVCEYVRLFLISWRNNKWVNKELVNKLQI